MAQTAFLDAPAARRRAFFSRLSPLWSPPVFTLKGSFSDSDSGSTTCQSAFVHRVHRLPYMLLLLLFLYVI